MSSLAEIAGMQFIVGQFAPGCKLYFTASGGSVAKTAYLDEALMIASSNPAVADGVGRFRPIYLQREVLYRVRLESATGTTIFTRDGVSAAQLTTQEMQSAISRFAHDPIFYGAVGDGIANDAGALQATIDAAASSLHPVVDLCGKTYKALSNVNVPAGITIRNGKLSSANFIVVPGSLSAEGSVTSSLTESSKTFNTPDPSEAERWKYVKISATLGGSAGGIKLCGFRKVEKTVPGASIALVEALDAKLAAPQEIVYQACRPTEFVRFEDIEFGGLGIDSEGDGVAYIVLSRANGGRLQLHNAIDVLVQQSDIALVQIKDFSGIRIEDCTLKDVIFDVLSGRAINPRQASIEHCTIAGHVETFFTSELSLVNNRFLSGGRITVFNCFAVRIADNDFYDGTDPIKADPIRSSEGAEHTSLELVGNRFYSSGSSTALIYIEPIGGAAGAFGVRSIVRDNVAVCVGDKLLLYDEAVDANTIGSALYCIGNHYEGDNSLLTAVLANSLALHISENLYDPEGGAYDGIDITGDFKDATTPCLINDNVLFGPGAAQHPIDIDMTTAGRGLLGINGNYLETGDYGIRVVDVGHFRHFANQIKNFTTGQVSGTVTASVASGTGAVTGTVNVT